MRKTKITNESPEKLDLQAVPKAHEALWEAYRRDPARFAREVLGSQWWRAQEETAALVANHRRVAVKAANGVGKTYLAADLLLWFLFCFRPSVVLTTAPTWRQVESRLWGGVGRRVGCVIGVSLLSTSVIDEGVFVEFAEVWLE